MDPLGQTDYQDARIKIKYTLQDAESFVARNLGHYETMDKNVTVYTISLSNVSFTPAELPSRLSAITVLSHPNVLSVVDVLLDDKLIHVLTESADLPLFVPHMLSLPDYTINFVRGMFYQAVRIVADLHQYNLYHNCITPLAFYYDEANESLILADMYIGFLMDTVAIRQMLRKYKAFIPPEMTGNARQYNSTKNDVYQLGVLLDLMLTGGNVIVRQNARQVPELELQGKDYARGCDLIQRMVAPGPRRITLAEALKHPFFTDITATTEPIPLLRQKMDFAEYMSDPDSV